MTTLSTRARAVVLTSSVLVWGVLTYACSVEDENPAPPGKEGVESGVITPGVDPAVAPTLPAGACEKYGNADGVQALARAMVDEAKKDCRISPSFTDADNEHFIQCFQTFLAGSFSCPNISYTQGTTVDAKGVTCESILPNLKLGADDWRGFADFFIAPAGAVKAVLEGKGLAGAELTTIGLAFEAKRSSVLDATVPAGKYTRCATACTKNLVNPDACKRADGGGGGGGGDAGRDAGRDANAPADAAADG